MPELRAGTDARKAEYDFVVIGTDAKRKVSPQVINDETALLKLVGDVLELSRAGRAGALGDRPQRRRLNVLWVLIHDDRTFEIAAPRSPVKLE